RRAVRVRTNPRTTANTCTMRHSPMARRKPPVQRRSRAAFDVESFLESSAKGANITHYRRGVVVFSQGDRSRDVKYLQKGAIKLSVLSRGGKEAVAAMLSPGTFFGEGVLAGQPVRIATATAVA